MSLISSPIQSRTETIQAAGAFFVPAASFTPVLGRILHRPAQFDAAARAIEIGAAPAERTYDLASVVLEEKANGMLIRIPSARKLGDLESILKPDGWLYVTVADARADVAAINATKPKGLVAKVVAIQSPASVQLTFKFNGPVAASELLRPEGSNDILVSIRTPGAEDASAAGETEARGAGGAGAAAAALGTRRHRARRGHRARRRPPDPPGPAIRGRGAGRRAGRAGRRIGSSKEDLEALLGKQIAGFSYPNGRATAYAKGLLREMGFTYAGTSLHDVVRPGSDAYELARFWQRDVDRLNAWMNVKVH